LEKLRGIFFPGIANKEEKRRNTTSSGGCRGHSRGEKFPCIKLAESSDGFDQGAQAAEHRGGVLQGGKNGAWKKVGWRKPARKRGARGASKSPGCKLKPGKGDATAL